MVAEVPWIAIGSFGSGAGSIYLLTRLREHWGKPGAKWFVATIATVTVWCLTYGIALLVFDPTIRLALEIVTWVCLIWIGVFFLAFALGYTGRTAILNNWWFRSIVTLPLAASVAVVTNPVHSLVWEGFQLTPAGSIAAVSYTILPFGLLTILGAMLFVSFGTVLVFDTVVSYGPLYRREAIAVGLSPIPPGFAILAWTVGIGPAVNLTTVMFLPHIALDLYAFIRSDMYEFNPATRRAGERAAIDDIATPVAITDVQGRIVNLNPAAEAMLAIEKQNALKRSLDALLVGDSLTVDGEPARISVENGSQRREYKIQQTPLNDGTDTHLGYTIVFQDITDEVLRERRLEVLNRFLRHNVRNEGVVIQGRAALLAENLDDGLAAHATTIESAVERLVESGDKARTLSEASATADDLVSVSLEESVSNAVASVADTYDGEVEITIPSTVQLTTQPTLLDVLVSNLVENALQHTDSDVVTVTGAVEDDEIVLMVSDDGPGVPEHELAVLERGRETDLNHGSGIGLWLVRWAVTLLDGTIEFETDGGTTATVRLPRVRVTTAQTDGVRTT